MWKFGVLFVLAIAVTAAIGEDEVIPCTTDESVCIDDGWTPLTIINDEYYCCGAGFELAWGDDGKCTCTKSQDVTVVVCDEGEEACKNASQFVADFQDKTQCCQTGFTMQLFQETVNEIMVTSCTCSQIVGNNGTESTSNIFSISSVQIADLSLILHAGDEQTDVVIEPGVSASEVIKELEALEEDLDDLFDDDGESDVFDEIEEPDESDASDGSGESDGCDESDGSKESDESEESDEDKESDEDEESDESEESDEDKELDEFEESDEDKEWDEFEESDEDKESDEDEESDEDKEWNEFEESDEDKEWDEFEESDEDKEWDVDEVDK